MKSRIRTVNNVGKGKYYTTSWKVSEYIIVNIVYFLFFYVYYLLFKYCLYIPIKWCVLKIKEMYSNSKKA